MQKIEFALGSASGTAIAEVNADATLTPASGGASAFAGLVISNRGKINAVLNVNGGNYKTVLGAPIHPRTGAAFEPFRHVATAVNGGNGYVVRVPAPGMMIPAISLALTDTTLQVKNSAFAAGSAPALQAGNFAMFYIDDGDSSANRTLSLVKDESSEGLLLLTLSETGVDGVITPLEQLQVSFDPDAKNDMGATAYVTAALEGGSTRIRAILADDAMNQAAQVEINVTSTGFVGGTSGDFSKIVTADYSKALDVLKKSMASFNVVLGLGCYDAASIAELVKFGEDCRVDVFYDLKGSQMATDAIKEAQGHNLGGSHQAARYYFPYSARDAFSSLNVVYGISCDAFVAKAKGVALVSDVGGYHYAPAGQSRGVINRTNITLLPNLDQIDKEAFVTARINGVGVAKDGSVYIDDSLTTFSKNNYLRFQHVSSLMNAIARQFYEVAEAVKHEPDGITRKGLTDGMTGVCERFFAAGALVTPRDTSQGTEPFIVTVTQGADIDSWQVKWQVCPTGTARRISGEPVLMR